MESRQQKQTRLQRDVDWYVNHIKYMNFRLRKEDLTDCDRAHLTRLIVDSKNTISDLKKQMTVLLITP